MTGRRKILNWLPTGSFGFVWLVMLLAGMVSAAILVTKTDAYLDYNAVVVEGTAELPTDDRRLRRHIHDGDQLVQWFTAPVRRLARLGLGVGNPRPARPGARLTIDLITEEGQIVASTGALVSQLREDDITLLPLATQVDVGRRYGLKIHTEGVPASEPIDLYYDSDELAPDGTSLNYWAAETPSRQESLPGSLRFQVIQDFSWRGVAESLLYSPQLYLLAGYWLLLLVVLVPAVRRWIQPVLDQRLPLLSTEHIKGREWMFVWLLAAVLALFVTWPFYANLNEFDTQGDVNRGLIFRALGRVGFLQHGEVALWDHYSCGGWPLLANINSSHLDPFFPLVLLFGEQIGMRLLVTATLMIGFVGAFALARRFMKADRFSALLAGAIFSYSGFQMLGFSSGVFVWVTVGLVPWVLYFLLASQQRTGQVVWASLALSAIFLGGGPHIPAFTVMVAVPLMILLAVLWRSWRPVLLLFIMLLLTVSVTAVKLIPAVELVTLFDNFERQPVFVAPLAWVPQMFWERNQLTTPSWIFPLTGEVNHWTEFGSYVGVVPALLFLIGIPLLIMRKHSLAVLLTAAFIFPMVFGLFPWTVLREVPVVAEILRTPHRIRSVVLLLLGLLVAASSSYWIKRLVINKMWQSLIALALATFVIVDLVSLHAPLFPSLFDLPEVDLPRAESFERVTNGYSNDDLGYYRSGYVNYLANQGTTDLCVPYMVINRDTVTVGTDSSNPMRPYRGEAYYLTGERAKLKHLTSNRFEVTMPEPLNRRLVINENFFPGWQTEPPREVTSHLGLLSVNVTNEDQAIIFQYAPLSYQLGKWISIASLALITWWIIRERKRLLS